MKENEVGVASGTCGKYAKYLYFGIETWMEGAAWEI
jgi:hypothetical protein